MARIVSFDTSMSKAVIALWNACLGTHYPLTDRLFRQNVLASPLGSSEGNVVAVENGQIAGWLLFRVLKEAPPELSRYVGRASIGSLCVHPDRRRRGIGSMLYAYAKTFALERGATRFSVVHYPHHLLPGVPEEAPELKAFLSRRGFGDWHEAYDLYRELTDPALAHQLEEAGGNLPRDVTMRPARHDDEEALIAFMGREFPGGWQYDTRRFLEADGAPEDVIIALEHNTIIGFAHTHTPGSIELRGSTHWFPLLGDSWGGLGPMGIAKTHRGRGLGYAVLCAGVQHLRTRGVEKAIIDWTVLVDFYSRLGFRIWKRYSLSTTALKG